MSDILDQLLQDLQDEELRDSVVNAAARALPLPDPIERQILTLLWTYAAQRLEKLISEA